VGQCAMSAAIGAPVTVMKNAGEGGAWGIAVLALFTLLGGQALDRFLGGVFENSEKSTVSASEAETNAFQAFMTKYKKALSIERLAGEVLSCWKN